MRRILLYKTGNTAPEVISDVGDYFGWFSRILAGRAELVVHQAFEAPRAACAAGFDGIVVTGSPASLVTPEPWMDEAADFLCEAARRGVPVLGTCFGHQLLGRAFGGTVRINPRGWEAGSHEVRLTDAGRRDPLFRGLPERMRVNQSHRDEVGELGPGVTRLAEGEHTENQAIAVGEHVRGVQFHPEMTGTIIGRLIRHRHAILRDDWERRRRAVEFHPERLLARAADTPDAERVVLNFLDYFAARA